MLMMVSTATNIETTLRTVLFIMIITLREDESIVRTVRRHRATLTGTFGLPLLALATAGALGGFYQFSFFGYRWQAFTVLAALSLLYIGIKVTIWRRNVIIVTNQRVVHHAQKGLFRVRISEAEYGDIADVVIRKQGLSALMGDRGTVVITTKTGQKLVMDDVASPGKVVELIHKMRRADTEPKPYVASV